MPEVSGVVSGVEFLLPAEWALVHALHQFSSCRACFKRKRQDYRFLSEICNLIKMGARALEAFGVPYVRAMTQSEKVETLDVLTVFITFLNVLGHLHIAVDLARRINNVLSRFEIAFRQMDWEGIGDFPMS